MRELLAEHKARSAVGTATPSGLHTPNGVVARHPQGLQLAQANPTPSPASMVPGVSPGVAPQSAGSASAAPGLGISQSKSCNAHLMVSRVSPGVAPQSAGSASAAPGLGLSLSELRNAHSRSAVAAGKEMVRSSGTAARLSAPLLEAMSRPSPRMSVTDGFREEPRWEAREELHSKPPSNLDRPLQSAADDASVSHQLRERNTSPSPEPNTPCPYRTAIRYGPRNSHDILTAQ